MSTDTIRVDLQERTVLGKGLNGLRSSGQVPAVIHNHGEPSIHAMGDFVQLSRVYAQAGKHHPVEITVGDTHHLALIKDADFEPVKRQLRHVVFQAIKRDEKTTAEIPVVLVGEEIPAEKKSLLVLPQLDRVEVEALPQDLPDELTVDATTLEEVGDRLHVSDIKLPPGVTMLTEPELALAVVEMPRDQVAEADAAAAALAEDAQDKAEETEAGPTEAGDEAPSDDAPADSTEN